MLSLYVTFVVVSDSVSVDCFVVIPLVDIIDFVSGDGVLVIPLVEMHVRGKCKWIPRMAIALKLSAGARKRDM